MACWHGTGSRYTGESEEKRRPGGRRERFSPGFGFVDEKTREIVGYDVDFVKAIAKKLGVKLELKPVTSASRMPQLVEGNIDIIAATMTKNAERAKQIDFSYTYFFTGQKFIAKKGHRQKPGRSGRQKDRHRQRLNFRAECKGSPS